MAAAFRQWEHIREAWRQDHLLGIECLAYKHLAFQREKRYVACRRKQVEQMRERHEQRDGRYHRWFLESLPDEKEKQAQRARSFSHRLTILIPVYNTDPEMMKALARSLLDQTCGQWEAIWYDGASPKAETRSALREVEAMDPRFHVVFGKENLGISGNTNRALEMVQTEYVALCDHDDLLTCDAVYWLLDAFEQGADFCYSDEDKCTEAGDLFFEPHLKSDFAPDSLRSGNYICHLMGMSTDLMRRVGGLRSEYDGSQDHDLALRATEQAACIAHVPRVLYHWRMVEKSFSHEAGEHCVDAAARAVGSQLARMGWEGRAGVENLQIRLDFPVPKETGVSLIVHGNRGRMEMAWLGSLMEHTGEDAEKIRECILVGKRPLRKVPSRLRDLGWTFLRADTLAEAGQKASGDVLLFLEQGMEPQEPEWLHRGLMMATRPWIGQVGGGIVDQNANYLSCGYAVDAPGGAMGSMSGESWFELTFQLYGRIIRNVSAVSSCYLLIRRDVFLKNQRFGEFSSDLGSVALGLDCLRHRLYNVVIPNAVMRQTRRTRLLSPRREPPDLWHFIQLYGEHPKEHYYSPHFEKGRGYMTVDWSRHSEVETDYACFLANGQA